MLDTKFTELVGCKIPIQQAPIGGRLARLPLAIAAAEAGALGMVVIGHTASLIIGIKPCEMAEIDSLCL